MFGVMRFCLLACVLVAGGSLHTRALISVDTFVLAQSSITHHPEKMSLSRHLTTALRVSRTGLSSTAVPKRAVAVRGFAKTALVRENGYDKHRVQVRLVSLWGLRDLEEADVGLVPMIGQGTFSGDDR